MTQTRPVGADLFEELLGTSAGPTSADPTPDVDAALAAVVAVYPDASATAIMLWVAGTGDSELAGWCAQDPCLVGKPLSILWAAAVSRDLDERGTDITARHLSVSTHLSPTMLYAFTAHNDPQVRMTLAANPVLSERAVTVLAADRFHLVRYALASNPMTSPHVLATLATDDHTEVSDAAVNNPRCPRR